MKPVDQDKFVASEDADPRVMGNCMQAAAASMMEVPLDEVPHFAAQGDAWWSSFVEWHAERGYAVEIFTTPVRDRIGYVTGKSPRGDFWHLVIGDHERVLHDPHPSRDGIAEAPMEWWYLLPIDPAEVNR